MAHGEFFLEFPYELHFPRCYYAQSERSDTSDHSSSLLGTFNVSKFGLKIPKQFFILILSAFIAFIATVFYYGNSIINSIAVHYKNFLRLIYEKLFGWLSAVLQC